MTDVWSYDGDVPGPELRFKQGERLDNVRQAFEQMQAGIEEA